MSARHVPSILHDPELALRMRDCLEGLSELSAESALARGCCDLHILEICPEAPEKETRRLHLAPTRRA